MRSRVFVVSLLIVLGLTACAPSQDSAEPTSEPASEPTSTSTPTPTATHTFAPAVIPTDCTTVVDAEIYDATFSGVPLNDPALGYPAGTLGIVSPTAPAADAAIDDVVDAATQLRCVWRDPGADVTYLAVQIGSVESGVGSDYLASLKLADYTCDDALNGVRCTLLSVDPQYQVDVADTAFVRDDIVIRIGQANLPTDNLLGAVVATVWAE